VGVGHDRDPLRAPLGARRARRKPSLCCDISEAYVSFAVLHLGESDMMRISLRAALAAGLAIGAAAIAAAQGTGWYGIGQAVAQPDAGSVTIAAHGDPHNHEIMFCVEGHN